MGCKSKKKKKKNNNNKKIIQTIQHGPHFHDVKKAEQLFIETFNTNFMLLLHTNKCFWYGTSPDPNDFAGLVWGVLYQIWIRPMLDTEQTQNNDNR